MHCLVYGRFIPQHAIAKEWEKLTGSNVVYIVNVLESYGQVEIVARYMAKTGWVDGIDGYGNKSAYYKELMQGGEAHKVIGKWEVDTETIKLIGA